jgi:hypothetical protein
MGYPWGTPSIPKSCTNPWSESGDRWFWGKRSLSGVHSLNLFSGGDGLIFLGRSFGKSFFVVLWGLGSNLVIFGGRLIEFCLFPFPSRRLKFYSGLFSEKKPGISGLLFRTFSPDFYSGKPGDSGKKCGDSGLSSGVCLGLFDCASALFLSLL